MSDLILHHYPMSPFAEKVRLILGFKGLAWRSVQIPSIMPKPDLQALTGGYRRTPVLQVGADIYCDTALICDVLEHRQPAPALYPPAHKGAARILAQWADHQLFTASMAYNFNPAGAPAFFASQGWTPEAAKAFGIDRAAMRGGAPRMYPADAAASYRSYLRRIANILDDQTWLLGDAPCLADFAVYHPLWFTRRIPTVAGIFDATPNVLEWMDRVAAFGHGTAQPLQADEAVAIAAAAEPAPLPKEVFQDEHGIPLGSPVTITAESFGLEATSGELVAASRTHYTLRRQDARAGTVHVHFPRVGFVLKKAEA
ncbi:MAG TPA: glutathione S-transferase family protein [Burkholderiaceae bacterium]